MLRFSRELPGRFCDPVRKWLPLSRQWGSFRASCGLDDNDGDDDDSKTAKPILQEPGLLYGSITVMFSNISTLLLSFDVHYKYGNNKLHYSLVVYSFHSVFSLWK